MRIKGMVGSALWCGLSFVWLGACSGQNNRTDAGQDTGADRTLDVVFEASHPGSDAQSGTLADIADVGKVTNCANPDGDGDGHRAIACGGDDCDDADSNRYPGRAEVCDPANHDEDCDPATFGVLDSDHDNYTDVAC